MADARGYGDLKAAVAEAVVAELAPVRERYAELRPDEAALEARARRGRRARRARSRRRRSPTCARRWASAAAPAARAARRRRDRGPRRRAARRRHRRGRSSSTRCSTRRWRRCCRRSSTSSTLGEGRGRRARRLLRRSARCSARCPAASRPRAGAPRRRARRAWRSCRVSGVAFAFGDIDRACSTPRASARASAAPCPWTAGLAWLGAVAPRERRGEAIGYAIGAGIFGAQFGPVRRRRRRRRSGARPTFSAVAALGAGARRVWARREHAPPAPSGQARRAGSAGARPRRSSRRTG